MSLISFPYDMACNNTIAWNWGVNQYLAINVLRQCPFEHEYSENNAERIFLMHDGTDGNWANLYQSIPPHTTFSGNSTPQNHDLAILTNDYQYDYCMPGITILISCNNIIDNHLK